MSLVEPTQIDDVKIITPRRFADHRGFFSETYSKKALAEEGINLDFVQDNHSLSVEQGVLRGLHFQIPPFAQDKLIRVISGSIYDVAVDIRHNSPTYGQHVGVTLTADNGKQLLVPKGFAHGFVTLEPDTQVIYKVTQYYAPECDKGLMWNDPDLGIDWGITPDKAILSDKDKTHPTFKQLEPYF